MKTNNKKNKPTTVTRPLPCWNCERILQEYLKATLKLLPIETPEDPSEIPLIVEILAEKLEEALKQSNDSCDEPAVIELKLARYRELLSNELHALAESNLLKTRNAN